MSVLQAVAILAAGVAAGTINVVVGSGTLITFPVLIAFGYAPVAANVSNTLGLVPGSFSGAVGYRRELEGQRGRVLRFGAASLTGGITGAVALLVLPAGAFEAIVPAFIALALVLIIVQPRLARRLAQRRPSEDHEGGPATTAGVYATGVYGGYFGAAQGIMLLALLGVVLPDDLQRINGLKNVLAMLVNGVAGIIFAFVAPVNWEVVALIAGGSVLGGTLGARFGRRLPPQALRGIIVAVGLFAIVRLLVG